MNKYQEAYSYIKHYCELDDDIIRWPLYQKSINALQELVDKTTPKKRIYVEPTPAISSHYICPICKTKVSPICCYCETCGQKLE